MKKILVIIPGISDLKLIPVLKSNISKLKETVNEVSIHLYDYKNFNLDNIVTVDKIIQGDLNLYEVFIYYDNYVDNYDYILILLDDVYLNNFQLDYMINNHEKHNLDISSPSITLDSCWSHANMKTRNENNIDILYSLELFCYLLKPNSYHLWTSIMDPENGFGWFIDLNLYKILGLNLGLFHNLTVAHLIQRCDIYGHKAMEQAKEWYIKIGEKLGASQTWNNDIINTINLDI